MEKKFEDDELRKLLEEEYIKEADMIEEALFSDEDFEDFEKTEEEVMASYDKLVQRLKADGIYREEDETDDDAAEGNAAAESIPGRSAKVIPMPNPGNDKESKFTGKGHGTAKKVAKVAAIVAVCVLSVFGVSMTSQANRKYFIESVRYLTGDRTRVIIGNDDGNDRSKVDEYEAIEEIENELGVDMPEFIYRPDTFEFCDFVINPVADFAYVEYTYANEIITMYIDNNTEYNGSENFSLHGAEVATISVEDDLVTVFEVKDEQDEQPSYTAQWRNNDTFFQVSGRMRKDYFLKLVENIKY